MDRRELLRGLGGLGLLAALAGCAPSYPSLPLTIATGLTTGDYFPLGQALARAWTDELRLGIAPVVRSTSGSLDNMQLLTKGDVHIAISQLDVAAEQFDPQTVTEPVSLRALTRLYDDVVHVVVPKNSPIKSFAQLSGRIVSVGKTNSGVVFVAGRLLQAMGLSPTSDITPEYLGLDQSVAALQAGRIEAFFWSGRLPTRPILDLALAMPIRLIDLSDVLERAQPIYDSVYAPRQVPADTYAGVDRPVRTVYIRNVLMVRAEMRTDVAHDLVEAMFNRQSQIAAAAPSALTIDTRRGIGTEPVPLHPGAEQWFREARDSG